jgi:cytochrome c553
MKQYMRTGSVGLLLAGLTALFVWLWPAPEAPFTGHGDPGSLGRTYQRWKTAYEARGGARRLRLDLTASGSLSGAAARAAGRAMLDLADGRLQVDAAGLPEDSAYEVWLLDHRAASGIKAGVLTGGARGLRLRTILDRDRAHGFTLDAIVVVPSGREPGAGGLLQGSPSLFQRLYYGERAWTVALAPPGVHDAAGSAASAPTFAFLLPKAAHAAESRNPPAGERVLAALIARGRELFTRETFGGNGRTCATCHRPDNNHTIDPKYIARLPRTDPLFVAETNPALAELEKPALMRQFGLFMAHADGFDKPAVMRSVPHLLALSTSLDFETREAGGEFPEDSDFFTEHGGRAQALGWSQDGAPENGSLRDFTKGAVRQHLPRSLNRIEGQDFRMPTEDELDAMEAYMLSLGRNSEINLAALKFKSPLVEKGKLLFDQKQNPVDGGGQPVFGQSANCNGCHMNAGARSSTTAANPTRDTGVERMRDQLHRLADPSVPYDGGFGQRLQLDCGPDYDAACYGDGSTDPRGTRPAGHGRLNRFNTPPLVEAADTGPFFHNNSIGTLEEAVAYYNTDAFNNSPGAFTAKGANRQTRIDSSQVQAVALFLRYINVLENIRSANQLAEKAMAASRAKAKELVRLAAADTEDAVEVIREAVFIPHPDALARLELAQRFERLAMSSLTNGQRRKYLRKAVDLQNQARAAIVSE